MSEMPFLLAWVSRLVFIGLFCHAEVETCSLLFKRELIHSPYRENYKTFASSAIIIKFLQ